MKYVPAFFIRFVFGLCVGLVWVSLGANLACAAEGFFSIHEIQDMPPEVFEATKAVFKFGLKNGSKSCTAFAISDDGYALTALHCLRGCLIEKGVMKESAGESFQAWTNSTQTPIGLKCELYLRDEPNFDKKFPEVDVVFLGKSFAQGDLTLLKANEPEKYNKLFEEYGDYAIVKFPEPRVNCISTRELSVQPGERLWALGFPGATKRWFNNSNGDDLFISRGQVYGRQQSLDAAAASLMWPTDIFWHSIIGDLNETISTELSCRESECLYSDVDIYSGDSGSPGLDDQGQLIGVNVAGYSSSNEYKPFGVTILADYIYNQVRELSGASAAANFFSCKK